MFVSAWEEKHASFSYQADYWKLVENSEQVKTQRFRKYKTNYKDTQTHTHPCADGVCISDISTWP